MYLPCRLNHSFFLFLSLLLFLSVFLSFLSDVFLSVCLSHLSFLLLSLVFYFCFSVFALLLFLSALLFSFSFSLSFFCFHSFVRHAFDDISIWFFSRFHCRLVLFLLYFSLRFDCSQMPLKVETVGTSLVTPNLRCVPPPSSPPSLPPSSPPPLPPSPLLSPFPSPWHPLHLRGRNHAFSRIQNKSVTDGRIDEWTDRPSYRDAWTHLKNSRCRVANSRRFCFVL